MRASSMEFTYSQTGVSKIEEIIVGRLKKNNDIQDGTVTRITPTSRAKLLCAFPSPFHQGA